MKTRIGITLTLAAMLVLGGITTMLALGVAGSSKVSAQTTTWTPQTVKLATAGANLPGVINSAYRVQPSGHSQVTVTPNITVVGGTIEITLTGFPANELVPAGAVTLAGIEVAIPGQPPPGPNYDPGARVPGAAPVTDGNGDVAFTTKVPNEVRLGVQTLAVNFAGSGVVATTVTVEEHTVLVPLAAAENGDFETGSLTGWTFVEAGNGGWSVYSGGTSPISGQAISAPPQGTFAATTDQTGPGSHILYQNIALEPGFSHTLSFSVYYENRAGAFFTPNTLGHTGGPNQQYRVDLMDPATTIDAIGVTGAAVLANIFQTKVGDPLRLASTNMTFDLTPFAGSTVRLRFAEVDNQFFFQASVDDVKVVSEPLTPDADLSITKTGSPDPVAAGADLTYELTVTNENSGAYGATGVIVTDTFPGEVTFKSAAPSQGVFVTNPVSGTLTWDVGDLFPGQLETLDIVVTVAPVTPDGTVLTNTAVVQGEQADLNPSNDTATVTTTVTDTDLAICTLVLSPSYLAGILTVEATVGTSVAATKNIWGTAQSSVLNLESAAIPVTEPPATTQVFSGPVPAQGVVAVFATLTTPELGIICSDFKTVDTGSPPLLVHESRGFFGG